MNKSTLATRDVAAWVDYIQTLHAREIDLSLDRVREVFLRLLPQGVNFKVIGVAGTNGKGSTSELLRSIYHEAGFSVGKYTSPHIHCFNERVDVDGTPVLDADLLDAFKTVEMARSKTRLTYFEYATLAALEVFTRFEIDIAIVEVGLGGRLDATNILDADLAIVSSISLDHTSWLGDTLEKIGREKIGIARKGSHCVLGMRQPTESILNHCTDLSIEPMVIDRQFGASLNNAEGSESVSTDVTWNWYGSGTEIFKMDLPFQQAGHQINNAATAIQAVKLLESSLAVPESAIRKGISRAVNQARCQLVSTKPYVILDVAHNVDAVKGLYEYVCGLPIQGRILAVCGMLQDKQISETLKLLSGTVDEWHFASINNERGSEAIELQEAMKSLVHVQADNGCDIAKFQSYCHDSALEAFSAARLRLTNDDCLLVFGSFFMVSDIIAEFGD